MLPGRVCRKVLDFRAVHVLQRDAFASRDHKVVKHPHINQCKRVFQTAGNRLIRMTGLSNARWMIVKKTIAAAFTSMACCTTTRR